MTPAAAKVQIYPDMPVPETAPAPPNIMALVLFVVVLLAMFLGILFLSLREQRREANKNDGLKAKLGF
jgi:preprotein translocase subunit YajC